MFSCLSADACALAQRIIFNQYAETALRAGRRTEKGATGEFVENLRRELHPDFLIWRRI